MAYALVGIPMTLLLLAAFVERLLVPVNAVLSFTIRMAEAKGVQPIYAYVIHFTGVILFMCIFKFCKTTIFFYH